MTPRSVSDAPYHDVASGCWPTPDQELLLRASLLVGDAAHEAWDRWTGTPAARVLDPESYRLFPLLFKRLNQERISDSWRDMLATAYKAAWTANQVQFRDAGIVLEALRDAGIRTIVLKGAALTTLYYEDVGVRPMGDVDMAIHPADVPKTLEILGDLGWQALIPVTSVTTEIIHSTGLCHDSKRSIDLHWHAMQECCSPEADTVFWEGAMEMRLGAADTLALNPADQLIHVCVHGSVWQRHPPIHWIADAMKILEASTMMIDWDRVANQVERWRLILPVREGLAYLNSRLDAPIPNEALARLDAMPVPRIERQERAARTRSLGPMGSALRLGFHYRRISRLAPSGAGRIGFITFLRHVWGVERPADVLTRGMWKARNWDDIHL